MYPLQLHQLKKGDKFQAAARITGKVFELLEEPNLMGRTTVMCLEITTQKKVRKIVDLEVQKCEDARVGHVDTSGMSWDYRNAHKVLDQLHKQMGDKDLYFILKRHYSVRDIKSYKPTFEI